jgi:hypothetical protein
MIRASLISKWQGRGGNLSLKGELRAATLEAISLKGDWLRASVGSLRADPISSFRETPDCGGFC